MQHFAAFHFKQYHFAADEFAGSGTVVVSKHSNYVGPNYGYGYDTKYKPGDYSWIFRGEHAISLKPKKLEEIVTETQARAAVDAEIEEIETRLAALDAELVHERKKTLRLESALLAAQLRSAQFIRDRIDVIANEAREIEARVQTERLEALRLEAEEDEAEIEMLLLMVA